MRGMRHREASSPLSALAVALLLATASCGGDDPGATSPASGDGGPSAAASADAGGEGGGTVALPPPKSAAGWQKAFAKDGVGISCTMSEADIIAKGAPSLTFAGSRVFAGFEQVGNNQNPVVARFDAGKLRYCERHETAAPDGRALAVTWDGGKVAYVLYTIVGGGSELDQKSKGGWLESYGNGGGAKVTVLGAVDAESGLLSAGTFVIAKKADGKTNTHTPTDAVTVRDDGDLEIRGSSAFLPVNPDRSSMDCTAYPFDTRYVFAPDLKTLRCSTSTNCTPKQPCP
jgi:hypothetical protein